MPNKKNNFQIPIKLHQIQISKFVSKEIPNLAINYLNSEFVNLTLVDLNSFLLKTKIMKITLDDRNFVKWIS